MAVWLLKVVFGLFVWAGIRRIDHPVRVRGTELGLLPLLSARTFNRFIMIYHEPVQSSFAIYTQSPSLEDAPNSELFVQLMWTFIVLKAFSQIYTYVGSGLFLGCRSASSRFFVSVACSPSGLLMKSCKCLQESISIDLVIYRAPWWQDCSTLGSEAPVHSSDGPWGWLVLHSCQIVNHALTIAWKGCSTTIWWVCVCKKYMWNLQIPLHHIIYSFMRVDSLW